LALMRVALCFWPHLAIPGPNIVSPPGASRPYWATSQRCRHASRFRLPGRESRHCWDIDPWRVRRVDIRGHAKVPSRLRCTSCDPTVLAHRLEVVAMVGPRPRPFTGKQVAQSQGLDPHQATDKIGCHFAELCFAGGREVSKKCARVGVQASRAVRWDDHEGKKLCDLLGTCM
jgi:hypothetical protein